MEMIEVLPIRVRITAILRKALLSGEFRPGEELSLTETVARLGVSRTPVREAFQSLAAEGLLTLRMNRGAIVVGIDEKVIQDHFELRLLLETEAVRRAVNRRPDITDLDRLQTWAEENRETMTEDEYRNYNQTFHDRLWRWADNQKLYGMLSSLWNGPSGGNVGRDPNHERLAIGEHRELLEHMRRGNAEAAGAVMTAHIVRSMNNILRSFRASRETQTEK
jgi:DNA-binding GntR family transcriptional regulator